MNYVIAISGTSGSGKSTLVNLLSQELKAASLYFDAYQETTDYPQDMMLRLANGERIDPEEVKSPVFASDIEKLKSGIGVVDPWGRELAPSKYVVVEEAFGRARKGMDTLLDLVVFVDIPFDVSLARRLLRDINVEYKDLEEGKKLQIITEYLTSYLGGLRNGYNQICNTARESADLIVDGLNDVNTNLQEILKIVP